LNTELANVRNNFEWTQKRNLSLSAISHIFYYGDDPKTGSTDFLLAMGGSPRFEKSPFLSLNYKKPTNERMKRNLLKSIYDIIQAVHFGFPGVAYLVSFMYDVFIMDDVRDALRWEARLVSALSFHPEKDFTKEIEVLYAQRVNPFEFDLDEENVFIERSKKYLGLR
jgi:hypothetical protein